MLISLSQDRAIAYAIGERVRTRPEGITREHSRTARRIVTLALNAQRYDEVTGASPIRINGRREKKT